MTHRQALVLLAAVASSTSRRAFAQAPPKIRRIGFLTPRSSPDTFFDAFREGMRKLGG